MEGGPSLTARYASSAETESRVDRSVLHVGTLDDVGGAARAARRLHDGLLATGWDSHIAAGILTRSDPRMLSLTDLARKAMLGPLARLESHAPRTQRFIGDVRLPLQSSRALARTSLFRRASVVNLHNLHGNFFDFRALPAWAEVKPLVWTLHDMWAFTGHVAYSYDCERWRSGCGDCPLRKEPHRPLDDIPQPRFDTTARAWKAKQTTYSRTPLTLIAPSAWLADLARESILVTHPDTTVRQIPYGLDTAVFRPVARDAARQMLGIDPTRKVILFGSTHVSQARKGFDHLARAIESLRDTHPDIEPLVLGPGADIAQRLPGLRALGSISYERLQATVYSAADVVAVPSLADNQPLIALEALACGVPVVGFRAGGIPELVRDGKTGFCADPGDAAGLAAGLDRILADDNLRARLGASAREQAVREHPLELQAQRYGELYDELRESPRWAARPTATPAKTQKNIAPGKSRKLMTKGE